jgi:type II restriction/modification system DNA methylase subunit YeeA
VSDVLLDQARELFEKYPYLYGQGRPLYSAFDNGETSIETYQLSEMLTYSERTLRELQAHALALADEGKSLTREILERTIHLLGYESLDAAEARIAGRTY